MPVCGRLLVAERSAGWSLRSVLCAELCLALSCSEGAAEKPQKAQRWRGRESGEGTHGVRDYIVGVGCRRAGSGAAPGQMRFHRSAGSRLWFNLRWQLSPTAATPSLQRSRQVRKVLG